MKTTNKEFSTIYNTELTQVCKTSILFSSDHLQFVILTNSLILSTLRRYFSQDNFKLQH